MSSFAKVQQCGFFRKVREYHQIGYFRLEPSNHIPLTFLKLNVNSATQTSVLKTVNLRDVCIQNI